MNQILLRISSLLKERLGALNLERESDGLPRLKHLVIKLMGQFGLRANPRANQGLHLTQTMDIDALLEGDAAGQNAFRQVLKELGFVYDELSSECWVPAGAQFEPLVHEDTFEIKVLEAQAILVSKAVKAPDKNRLLIAEALALYGEKLAREIEKHGGDLNKFLDR